MIVNIVGNRDDISKEEIAAYEARATEKYGDKCVRIDIYVDGPDVELTYHLQNPIPFERIRRITGYLVGNMTRWNDAKKSEEKDRVKHWV